MNGYKKYLEKCKKEGKEPVGIVTWIANKENNIKRWNPDAEIKTNTILIKR